MATTSWVLRTPILGRYPATRNSQLLSRLIGLHFGDRTLLIFWGGGRGGGGDFFSASDCQLRIGRPDVRVERMQRDQAQCNAPIGGDSAESPSISALLMGAII